MPIPNVEGVEALLHLCAVVFVLTVAYIGLDRRERTLDPTDVTFAAVRAGAEAVMNQLGLTNGSPANAPKSGSIAVLFPTAVIVMVAGEKLTLGFTYRIIFFLYRQAHIPFLKYYRTHLHMVVVSIMATLTGALFFAIGMAQVWRQSWIYLPHVQELFFITLWVVIFWVCLTGIFGRLLTVKSLTEKCVHLKKVVDDRTAKLKSKLQKQLAELERTQDE